MHSLTRLTATLALLTTLATAFAAPDPRAHVPPSDDLDAFAGDWLYVRDVTEGRPTEEQGPPMSAYITLRVEEDAVVWVRPGGDERIMIDGSSIDETRTDAIKRNRGAWKDGVLEYVNETVRESDGELIMLLHREFRITPDGLQIRVVVGDPEQPGSLALYRHPEDIAPPVPAPAKIADIAWLSGAWVGTRGSSSVEERWAPPRGGAMLGTSSTVKGERLTAFEYLRVLERDGGLVYVAQPNGGSSTEFVLTALDTTRAVFDNPRHDYPQRIVYELSADGALSASIGFLHGGRPTRFDFTRESR